MSKTELRRYNAAYQRKRRAAERAVRNHPTFLGMEDPVEAAVRAFDPVDRWPDDPATAVAEWAEAKLVVPTGILAGKPFVIPDWQREFLAGALAPDVREAALCTARKNGKTGIIAALLLAHLVGPLRLRNWRCIVVSLTGPHAAELKRQVGEICEASAHKESRLTDIRNLGSPPPGRILGPFGEVQCLAADKSSGHAVGCDLAIIDEAGLLEENKREMWQAVSTSRSGRDGRLVSISVRGHSPMFREQLEREGEPGFYIQRHEPDRDADPFDPATWAAANPGLESGIKSLNYLQNEARKARGSAADMRGFRTWELNQPMSPEDEPLVDPAAWEACETDSRPERGGLCFLGVDLGASLSLSAACAVWESGRVEWWHAASESPDPLERGRRDGVGSIYADAVESGHLILCGGEAVDWQRFLARVFSDLSGERVIMGADRFRKSELVDAMARGGFRPQAMEWRGIGAGPTADGSHDVRSFQRAVAHRTLHSPRDPIARVAFASAVLRRDPAGNPGLDKRHFNRRIDAASACVIACGLRAMAAARKVAAGGPGFRIARAG